MSQEPFKYEKKLNPYDLAAIAELDKSQDSPKPSPSAIRQPYEPERSRSAYDLSNRPGDDSNSGK